MPDGSRARWWCKVCRDAGREWLTEEACQHVIDGKEEVQIPREEAMTILRALMNEPSQSEGNQ